MENSMILEYHFCQTTGPGRQNPWPWDVKWPCIQKYSDFIWTIKDWPTWTNSFGKVLILNATQEVIILQDKIFKEKIKMKSLEYVLIQWHLVST